MNHCVTGRKVAGSTHRVVTENFDLINHFGRTNAALTLTQALTEMSTRDISRG